MISTPKRLIKPSRRWVARFARVGENEYEQSIIYKAANILAAEKVPGDYLEFGVASGRSLIRSYHIMRRVYQEHQVVHTGRRAEDAAAIGFNSSRRR